MKEFEDIAIEGSAPLTDKSPSNFESTMDIDPKSSSGSGNVGAGSNEEPVECGGSKVEHRPEDSDGGEWTLGLESTNDLVETLSDELEAQQSSSSSSHLEVAESQKQDSILPQGETGDMEDRGTVYKDLENSNMDSHNDLENQTDQRINDDTKIEGCDVESDEPSEDLHTTKLGKICRICGEMTVKYDGPKKGVPKQEVAKHVKKVWNVDISDESADVYPVNVCLSCERKIKRIYLKVSKRKKCELFREKPAEFVEHSGSDCNVCLLKEENPLPVLPCEPFRENSLGSEGAQEQQAHAVMKGNLRPQTMIEARRNATRKRSKEELKDSFRSVGSQTEPYSGLENSTALEEHDYSQDEALSQYLVMPKKMGGRTPYQKQSLCSVNAKYIRQDRLKPLISHIDKFCQVHKEDKIDVMFFLLIQTLRDANDRARENLIMDIWCKKNSIGTSLTDEECLAKRILLKQTKEQYRKEYCYYKEKLDKSVLKPPFIIDRLEKTYFPENLEYFVTDGESGPLVYQREKSTQPSYFTISNSQEANGKADSGRCSLVGARWLYFDAVAKTLEELSCIVENEIQDLDDDTYIHIDMSDYCEEKRDMTSFNDKTDTSGSSRGSQCKMMTYFFGIHSMQAVTENKITPLYKVNPNAVLFRPLMKAIVSEGSALHPTISAIELERETMADKIFHVSLPGGTPLRFLVNFTNASVEVRKDYRNIIGLSLASFKKVPVVINRYGSVCLELKRNWLASSPRLVHVSQVSNSRTKCSRCGEQGHNVRKCSVPSDSAAGDGSVLHKKRKKQRTIPPAPYPTPVSQPSQSLTRSSKVNELVSGQHQLQQQHQAHHPHPQQTQEPPVPVTPLVPVPANLDQETAVIKTSEPILWTCPGLANSHAPQNTQVLIPAANPTSNVQYQTVPQRSLTQTTPAPVYVWAYTVVQPSQGGTQQHPQELSLVQQSPQPAVPQQTQPLTVVHQHTAHQNSAQQHQQITVTHQQATQPGTPQQPQQLSVIHQQPGQPSTSQQSQQLSVIHQQGPQQTPPQLPLVHQPQLQQPSQKAAASQISLIPQQMNHVQQSQQQISVVHQQPAAAQSQLSTVHQQQAPHPAGITHQTHAQLHTDAPAETPPSQQQQIIHSQPSNMQPVMDSSWQAQ